MRSGMTWQDDHNLRMEREGLIEKAVEILGFEPPGIRVTLRVLAHPDLVQYTRRYFEDLDTSLRCLNYEPPWSCAKEAEARYENIQYGWLGGAGGIGFDESWCINCRKKVLPDD